MFLKTYNLKISQEYAYGDLLSFINNESIRLNSGEFYF